MTLAEIKIMQQSLREISASAASHARILDAMADAIYAMEVSTPPTPGAEPAQQGTKPLICGQNPTPIDADLVGCGKPIERPEDVYRCTDCAVPFHRACAMKHFATDTPEHAAKVYQEQLRRLDTPPAQKQAAEPVQQDTVTLRERIAELASQHGSMRAAARVLECNAGYLSRLCSGEKVDPGPTLLRRMGLREIVRYERATPPAEKQATWTPDQVEQVEKEAESMLGKLQASPQAPSGEGK